MRKYKNNPIFVAVLLLCLLTAVGVGAQNNLRLRITKIETDTKTVSQGQQGITVNMEIQNKLPTSITNINASLLFSAETTSPKLDLTHEYSQKRTDTITQIPGNSKVTLTFDVGVSQNATPGKIIIDGRFSGTALGFPSNVDAADKTDNWTVVPAASLLAKSVVGSVAFASSGQSGLSFSAVIENPGGANAIIDDLQLKFLFEGSSDRSGDFSVTPDKNPKSLDAGKSDTFNFTVAILPTAQSGNYIVDVSVFGRDTNSNAQISDLEANFPAALAIQDPARLEVEFTQIEPFQTVGDTFLVRANVRNLGDAAIDNSGELFLSVPLQAGYTLTQQTAATQSFQIDIPVIWQVVAPPVPTNLDTFVVRISAIPLELNSGLPAQLEAESDMAVVKTLDDGTGGTGTIVIDSVRIENPPGAKDGILSTDQDLTVTAYLHQINATEINATISFTSGGYGFSGGDDFTKTVADSSEFVSISWNLEAPRNFQPGHFIYIDASGLDSETGRLIDDVIADTVRASQQGSAMMIMVVEKANLNLTAEISAPLSARDSVLTIDQFFTVTARLENQGGADIEGEAGISINLPSGFSTLDPLTEVINTAFENEISWEVHAPAVETGISIITVRAAEPSPVDVNSNSPAPFIQNERLIPVLVTESICIITTVFSEKPVTVVKGARDIHMMGLTFENTGADEVSIRSVELTVADKNGNEIFPASVLSALQINDYINSSTVFNRINQLPQTGPIQLDFNPEISLLPEQSRSVEFRVDISEQTTQNTVQLIIKSPAESIIAFDFDQIPAEIKAGNCLPLTGNLTSGFSNINDSGFETNFFNYPNPFGSEQESETRFHYVLQQDSDVTLRIYTLLGELVWSRSHSAAETQGKAGLHDGNANGSIVWDGRNDKGEKVLNGVYVGVLKATGKQAVTKIAIAK